MHDETRLGIRISHLSVRSCCNAPYSANLASIEAPADRTPCLSLLSNSMMVEMPTKNASRNSAGYLNQPFVNKALLQRTIFGQFSQRRGTGGLSIAIPV